jgi:hypothetical protein
MFDPVMLGSAAVLVLFVFVLFVASRCVRYVGNNRVAVVEAVERRRLGQMA